MKIHNEIRLHTMTRLKNIHIRKDSIKISEFIMSTNKAVMNLKKKIEQRLGWIEQ